MLWETIAAECCEVCQNCSRLLKTAIKLPSSGCGQSFSRARGFTRRVSLNAASLERNRTVINNKENRGSATAVQDDIPVISSFLSPSKQISPSKFTATRQISSPLRQRQPLEDHDPNSQDSGYGTGLLEKDEANSGFRFTEPLGLAPRRCYVDQSPRKDIFLSPKKDTFRSPRKEIFPSSPQSKVLPLSRSLSSSSGCESIDDGFMDLIDCEKLDDDAQLSSGIGFLITGPLKDQNSSGDAKLFANVQQHPRTPLRRSHSLGSSQSSPVKSPSRNEESPLQVTTSSIVDNSRPFKRPDPPCLNLSPLKTKRLKCLPLQAINENTAFSPCSSLQQKSHSDLGKERPPPVRLQRSFSETEATIKIALQRSTQFPDLIGDFSRPFVLPLVQGRHQDLKTITPETLARVIRGEFSEMVDSYTIIDCRYPYEYDGGHIRGAKNIYTKEQIMREFVEVQHFHSSMTKLGGKRNILIFHCEFSSERGPSLSRFLRNSDRSQNKESYPALNYPEIYLLHGGYKDFYTKFKELCEPCAYLPMLHPKHESDLRHFRSKSKSWSGDSKSRLAIRNSLKRLGL
ncbi:M-phase inducer phosphatase isoform X2 [Anabrus simplex]|uniref:M-phase inducer phosphatase isoform X2 n=1 Tax=Anabrus simplex TaxID=316456 RepID=UPI0035A297DA